MIERRIAGEPVASLTGEREFYGRSFKVSPAVLIPRPETELLVDLALERMPRNVPTRILELGTGSGCIAIALASERSHCKIVALDQSYEALAVARRNAFELRVGNVARQQSNPRCEGSVIGVDDLSIERRASIYDRDLKSVGRQSQVSAIQTALDEVGGHRAKAAARLGVSERRLRYRLAEMRIAA